MNESELRYARLTHELDQAEAECAQTWLGRWLMGRLEKDAWPVNSGRTDRAMRWIASRAER